MHCYVAVTLRAAFSGKYLASTEFVLDGHPAEPSLGALLAWANTVRPPVLSRADVVFESRPGHSVSCRSRPFAKIRAFVEDLPVQPHRDRADRLDEHLCYTLTAALVELNEDGADGASPLP